MMSATLWPIYLYLYFLFCRVSLSQQIDPVVNFCFRYGHQSLIKNSTLYIDGGIESYISVVNNSQSGAWFPGLNNRLVTTDLSSSWDWKINVSQNSLQKRPAASTGTPAPVLQDAALFIGNPNSSTIHFWGGTTSYINTSFPGWVVPTPSTYTLWSVDLASNEWSQSDVTASNLTNRPSAGAATEASDLGLAFYYNGRIDGGSSTETQGLRSDNSSINLPGMIVINTKSLTATNYSTASASGDWPVALGGAEYIPSVGSHGVIVTLGGMAKHVGDSLATDDGNYTSLAVVDMFDVSSIYNGNGDRWFKQNTSGDIPQPRGEFCTVLKSDLDTSTHNLYVYGGREVVNGVETVYDDVYVLNIPSFTWSVVFQDGSSPRFGHTCHMVGETREMITVGDVSKTDTKTGQFVQTGFAGCDWEAKSVAILDTSSITWGSVYNASALEYALPTSVKKAITNSDGTIARRPQGGFDSVELATMFGQDNSSVAPWALPAATTPIEAPSYASTHEGAIIGGSIGGAVGVILIISICIWLRRRQKRRQNPPTELSSGDNLRPESKSESPVLADSSPISELRSPVVLELPANSVSIPQEMSAVQTDPLEMPVLPPEMAAKRDTVHSDMLRVAPPNTPARGSYDSVKEAGYNDDVISPDSVSIEPWADRREELYHGLKAQGQGISR